MDRLNKIERLKDRLYATDYIVLKEYEGLNVSEHGNFHEERQAIRDEINRLQGMTDEEYYEAYPEEREASPTYEDEPLLTRMNLYFRNKFLLSSLTVLLIMFNQKNRESMKLIVKLGKVAADKWLHFIVGLILAQLTIALLCAVQNDIILAYGAGMAVALAAGFVKELKDGSHADVQDFLFTLIGGVFGALLALIL